MREETDRAVSAPNAPCSDTHAARHGQHPSQDHTLREADTTPLFKAIRHSIMHALSQHERLLVVLWYVEQMSIREIGEILDLTDMQVRRTHERVVERLRAAAAPVTA